MGLWRVVPTYPRLRRNVFSARVVETDGFRQKFELGGDRGFAADCFSSANCVPQKKVAVVRMAVPNPTNEAELLALLVADLREVCKANGLSHVGKKKS